MRGWAVLVLLVVLGVSLVSCGSGASSGEGAQQANAGDGTCLDTTSSDSLCDTLVEHFARCTPGETTRAHLVEDCRATWGGFSERTNGCFLEQLAECMEGPCETVDAERCFREATVASDPDSFDESSRAACTSSGECDGLGDGWMGRCVQRLEECSEGGDLCATAVSLKRPFRGQVESCFDEECSAIEDCIYAAMGHH